MQLDAPLVCTVPWSVVCGLWCDCGLSVGPGMVGTLRVDDGSDKPFHVEAPGGAKWWYSADVRTKCLRVWNFAGSSLGGKVLVFFIVVLVLATDLVYYD